MLILTRKAKQRIVINHDIELVIVQISGDRVKLGFEAPRHVSIHREEVFDRIENEHHLAEEALTHEMAGG